jgi:myosin heavy subunit
VSRIEWVDNQPTLDLLLGKPIGVLPSLDEECRFPKASDLSYTRKVATNLAGHASGALTAPQSDKDMMFIVEHYAGGVKYDTNGFLNKNRDALSQDVINALRFSEDDLISSLWAARMTGTGTFRTVKGGRGQRESALSTGGKPKAQNTSLLFVANSNRGEALLPWADNLSHPHRSLSQQQQNSSSHFHHS